MPTRRSRTPGLLLVALLALALVASVSLLLGRGVGPLIGPEGCEVRAGGREWDLSTEQARNATTITAVAVRRGLPARAASIALATAYQESKLRNLDGGDRDSVGLFQERPSQGWGTVGQIRQPVYAANRFYDELVKIAGYQTMRITEAAQKVQRSGYPEAYQDHAEDGRALASALTGYTPAGFSCVTASPDDLPEQREGGNGLTARGDRVRRDLLRVFGDLPTGGYASGGVSTGHTKGSAHYDGRAVDVFVRPVSAPNKRKGWAIASYLVAHASRLHVDHIIFDKRIWSAGGRSDEGWRDYDPGERAGERAVLEHRDHVHVDVVAGG